MMELGGGYGIIPFPRCFRPLGFGTDAYKGVISVVDAIGYRISKCLWQVFRGADGAGNVIAAIDGIDEHIMVICTNMDKS